MKIVKADLDASLGYVAEHGFGACVDDDSAIECAAAWLAEHRDLIVRVAARASSTPGCGCDTCADAAAIKTAVADLP